MNVLYFDQEIDRRSIERLLVRLKSANAPRRVLVDSPGGEFEFFSVLGPAIERRGIITMAGDVKSAAVILFLLGQTRQALPDSEFYFHEVRAHVRGEGEITISSLEEFEEYERKMSGGRREAYQQWKRNMKAAEAWFLDFMSQRTGLRPAVFQNLMRKEVTLSARDAVHYGIVHEIVPSDFLNR